MHDLENARMEIALPGKCQNGKCTPRKMKEKAHTGKWQKLHNCKMHERKMHNLENDRKITPWKMKENIGNTHP